MDGFVDAIQSKGAAPMLTSVDMSLDSHLLAFAAEQSPSHNYFRPSLRFGKIDLTLFIGCRKILIRCRNPWFTSPGKRIWPFGL
jgi:hypothetical protein